MSDGVPIQRRTVVTTLGGLLAGGLTVTAMTPDAARAAVETNDLTISDGEYSAPDGEAFAVYASASGTYSFDVPDTVTDWRVDLQVGRGAGDPADAVIASQGGGAIASAMESSYNLAGKLSNADDWQQADFKAPDGESVSYVVPVAVRLAVLNDGSEVASAAARTESGFVVTDTGVTQTAGITGSGEIAVQGNESDPKPV